MNSDKKLYDISNRFNLTDIILKNDRKLDTQSGTWFDDGIYKILYELK